MTGPSPLPPCPGVSPSTEARVGALNGVCGGLTVRLSPLADSTTLAAFSVPSDAR